MWVTKPQAVARATRWWDKRHGYCLSTETYDERQAIDKAFEGVSAGDTPVYLSDSGDNPTAGSTADCTGFLSLLLDDSRTQTLKSNIIFGGIYDPDATIACKGKVGDRTSVV